MSLSQDELIRYQRHFSLDNVGQAGQTKLKQASVLCVGAGGLGCAALSYLTAAGIGHLGIIDGDVVELSNLQRQILYQPTDVNLNKAKLAAKRLRQQNPHCQFTTYAFPIKHDNALDIIKHYNIIIDGSDNFPTRYLVNDVCVILNKPNISASILRFQAQLSVYATRNGPCYRCLFPSPPTTASVPNCTEAGVIGTLPGILGTLQANEAIKLILAIGQPLIGKLFCLNALSMASKVVSLNRDPSCRLCQRQANYDDLTPDHEEQAMTNTLPSIDVHTLKQWQDEARDFNILDVREPHEHAICHITNTLIPLGDLPTRHTELDPTKTWVIQCKSGGRSAKAVQFLQQHGFKSIYNLDGGILAYAKDIDPSLVTY